MDADAPLGGLVVVFEARARADVDEACATLREHGVAHTVVQDPSVDVGPLPSFVQLRSVLVLESDAVAATKLIAALRGP